MTSKSKRKLVRITKPWGKMEQFTLNEPSSVHIYELPGGKKLHARSHPRWASYWKLIGGEAQLNVDGITRKLDSRSDEALIKRGAKHQIQTLDDTRLLVISLGDKFNNADIKYLPEARTQDWETPLSLAENQQSTVKILYVNPRKRLSYQRHKFRDEYWFCLDDEVELVLDDKNIKLKQGESITLPKGCKHRLVGRDKPGRVLEISYGFFDEEDIERLEDDFKRQGTTNIEGTK